ncbi:MAG: PocR ligand-binding domain-containing protein [Deltaproteobacteria bacterium]|nr:PocR ligand-binding domain-containing protein [Deltaproteobacteria bacterium]
MNDYRLSDLLDLTILQKMADAHYRAAGMPSGIIDAIDGSILVGSGWQDICVKFHRADPVSLQRCQESDNYIKDRLVQGEACHYKCKNGLWDIGVPIVVGGRHLATMFLGQFFYEGETPDRQFFIQLAHEFGFDVEDYLAALDRVPVFSREKVDYILEYNKALVDFITDLADHALLKIKAEEEIKRQAEFLQGLIDAMPYPVYYKDLQGRYISCNRTFEQFFGISRERLAGKTVHEVAPKERADEYRRADEELFTHPGMQIYEECIQSLGGGQHNVIFHKATFTGRDGALAGLVGAVVDITERKRVERALEESEAKTRSILDNIGIGVALISPEMEILELNHQMREWFPGIDPGQHPICYRAFNDPPREVMCDYCPTYKTLQDGQVHKATTLTPQADGPRNYRIVSSPILNASGEVTAAIEIVEDITETLSLESQLQQAQKLESVGRLAGGVAHDFNNMLGVILGQTELAMGEVDPAQSLFATLLEIRKAAERSADLTRQLLAFARKQTVVPRVLDLNEILEGMLRMLRRLIGEDIDLVWVPGKNLWSIKVDPSQIDQILANLCVNARDAIAGLGKVTIETENTTFDEAYCADHPGFIPGDFVMLAVSDDGHGMDKDTLDKIFEPFFTTKEIGRGTGLGLATVYGTVKQNSGFINVYSEPGHGTTFKIYLPRHAVISEQMSKETPAAPVARGHETILLVEDEPAILNMTRQMLERFGYRVLSASTPGEAIRMAREHAGEIHLLISDVVMPEMNGRELAKNLISLYPGLKRLFMSGYTANVIAHHGVLDEGIHFIQKPFSIQALAVKVREALDSEQ